MFPKSAPVAALVAAVVLAACGRTPPRAPDKPEADSKTAGYLTPPTPLAVRMTPAGVQISGTAPAGGQVRLGFPAGGAIFAPADATGRWVLALPPSDQPRIFGLSEKVGGRQAQAEGYVVVTPQGAAALLRAGAGAIRLDPLKPPAITAVDFDRDGAVLISGVAPADSLVFLRLDGRQMAEGRVDESGRYAIALDNPVPPGAHTLEIAGDNFVNTTQLEVSPPAPLVSGPVRSQLTKGGLRIDWLTPGGGVQSTLLVG